MNYQNGDRIKITGTSVYGTITNVYGPAVNVKFDVLPITVICYDDEIEPLRDDALIGIIKQSEADAHVPGSDFCVICGADVPEGRMVCGRCRL